MVIVVFNSVLFALAVAQNQPSHKELAANAVRSAIIDKLINDVGKSIDNNSKDEAAASIRVLGVYRATESIPLLIKHISFTPLGIVAGRPYRLSESRPCIYALSKIGGRECNDAVLGLVARLGTEDSIFCASTVLTISLGYDDAVTLAWSRASREKDGAIASRLRALAKSMEKNSRDTTYDD